MTELHDIKSKAKKFVRQNNIKNTDINVIKRVITSWGYKVIEYNRFANSEAVDTLLSALRVLEFSKTVYSFTYCDKNNKFVFLRSGLSDEDAKYVLAHEMAHIYLEHLSNDKNILSSNISNEYEANEFVHYVFRYAASKSMLVKNKIYILAAIVVIMLVSSICIGMAYKAKQQGSIGAATSRTGNMGYYATQSGKKYHLKDCIIIKDKTNIHELTQQELNSGEYEPCKVCMPAQKTD